MSGAHLEVEIASAENSKELKKKNPMGDQLPLLETDEGVCIAESLAICKYLAKVGPDGAGLMGSTAMQKVKVEQWLSFAFS